jgi:hypothetical protein
MPHESDESDDLFPLTESMDREMIAYLVKAIRHCFRRPDITAEQIHNLAILLFAVERLPLATPGVNGDLTLSYRHGKESNFQSIHIDGSTLSLSSGGYAYSPDVGGDSYGDEVLMVETGGFREVKTTQLVEWLAAFESRLEDAEIKISLDEAEVDWDDEPDETAWDRAAKHHAEPDSSEDDEDD